MESDPDHGLTKDAVRTRLCKSVAIAHGVGLHMSLLELCVYIDEHGLPTPEERERLLAAKLEEGESDGGDTTTFSSPDSVDGADASHATA